MKLKRPLRRLGFHVLKRLALVAGRGGSDRLRIWGERLGRFDFMARRRFTNALTADLITLGEQKGLSTLKQRAPEVLKEAYQTNDRALLEVLALYTSARDPQSIMPPIHLDRLDIFADAKACGRGVVLVGMHMGNGVALAAHLNGHVAPTHVVYRESNKIPTGFFKQGLEKLVASAIGAQGTDGGLRAMLGVLRRGEILYVLADQGLKGQPPNGRFLSKPFHLPTGPSKLAAKTQAPLLPVFLTGVDTGWRFEFQPPIWPNDSGTINQLNFELIQRMEQHILQHPQWWSRHQRRWSKHPFCKQETGVH